MIRSIEEYSINAWPALQTVLYDGWVLRFASGYTRRANSVNPLYSSLLPLDEKISVCEALYHRQELSACYKMTSASQPAGLDEALAARGYAVDAPTAVQLLDLSSAVTEMAGPGAVEITLTPTSEWQAAFASLSAIASHRQAAHEQILAAILSPVGYAAVRQDGQIVACGLGVLQNGYLGLFDVITDPTCRRQGHARQLVSALLCWGKRSHAHTAYLQVMLNNQPALNLYAGLRFHEAYQYWYRVKPLPTAR